MNRLIIGLSLALVVSTTSAGEISTYEQAIINGAGTPINDFTGKGELAALDFTDCLETTSCKKKDLINYIKNIDGDFGDCSDTTSCKKQDLIDYIKNNNNDILIPPIITPDPIKNS